MDGQAQQWARSEAITLRESESEKYKNDGWVCVIQHPKSFPSSSVSNLSEKATRQTKGVSLVLETYLCMDIRLIMGNSRGRRRGRCDTLFRKCITWGGAIERRAGGLNIGKLWTLIYMELLPVKYNGLMYTTTGG